MSFDLNIQMTCNISWIQTGVKFEDHEKPNWNYSTSTSRNPALFELSSGNWRLLDEIKVEKIYAWIIVTDKIQTYRPKHRKQIYNISSFFNPFAVHSCLIFFLFPFFFLDHPHSCLMKCHFSLFLSSFLVLMKFDETSIRSGKSTERFSDRYDTEITTSQTKPLRSQISWTFLHPRHRYLLLLLGPLLSLPLLALTLLLRLGLPQNSPSPPPWPFSLPFVSSYAPT